MASRCCFIPIILATVILVCGCTPLTVFQTPKVNDVGESTFGIGFSYIHSRAVSPDSITSHELSASPDRETRQDLELYYREGLIKNLDAGIKIGLFSDVCLDFKYQIIDAPFYVSVDLSYSLSYGYEFTNQVKPTLLIGKEWAYLGLSYAWSNYLGPYETIVVGSALGKGIKVLPILNIHFIDKYVLFQPAIGLQFSY